MHWQQVLGSSNVAAIAYDAEKKEAWVRFHGGSVYVYSNVGPGIWDEFLHSQSKGRFVQIQLKRAHPARKEADYVESGPSGKDADSASPKDPGVIPGGVGSKDLGYHN
jgi:hypothetical protein